MRVDTDRRHLLFAGILTAVLLLAVTLNKGAFFDGSTEYDLAFFATAGFLCIITGMFAAVTFKWKGRCGTIINTVYFFLVPVLSMLMLECINGVFIYDYSPRTFTANYIVYLFFYLLIYVFSGSMRLPVLIINPILLVFGIANYFVTSFRGSPIVPFDLFTVSTGLNVSSNYTYHLTYNIVLAVLIFLFLMISAFKFVTPKFEKVTRISSRIISVGLLCSLLVIFYSTDVVADNGFKPDFWDQSRGYRNSGTLLNFCLNTKYIWVSKPKGYNADDISDLMMAAIDNYDSQDKINGSAMEDYEKTRTASRSTDSDISLAASSLRETATVGNPVIDNELEKLASADEENVTKNTAGNVKKDEDTSTAATDSSSAGSDSASSDTASSNADTDSASSDTGSTNADTDSTSLVTDTSDPNIICIMNESLSDLSILGDLKTNIDYMPFMHSLTENTIKGNLYVPVNGAGTSNTEFEFLTGNSLAFLPAGSNVYQLYIDDEQPSLATTLGAQGYSKTAYHPFYASGWNRTKVYPLLGFDQFVSIEDMIDPDIIEAYKSSDNNVTLLQQMLQEAYPDQNMLLRRYISDSCDFDHIISMYEQKEDDTPMFLFNVTMQNHGGYALPYSNFSQQVYATDTSEYFAKANRYLSLVYESDKAFEKLVEYFKTQTEPTVICMFGDHQPYLEDSFFEELIGSDLDDLTLEQTQNRYVTPFVIWANFDIDEQYIDKISSNYLSTLVLETAGMQLTDYNEYLSTLYQSIPVIDTIGYIGSDDQYYTYDETSPYSDLLSQYEKIQYNNLFDTKNRINSLFYLE